MGHLGCFCVPKYIFCPFLGPQTVGEVASILALISPRSLPLPLLAHLLPTALPLPSSQCSSGAEQLLAEVLPVLVPSLVVSTRPALVPLILHTVAHHSDQETRDSLLQILFNLVKRPDDAVREKIVSGLHWLLCQPGWTSSRVEEEVEHLEISWQAIVDNYRK